MVIYSPASDNETVLRAENVFLCLVLCALTFLFCFLKVMMYKHTVSCFLDYALSACHCSIKVLSLPF